MANRHAGIPWPRQSLRGYIALSVTPLLDLALSVGLEPIPECDFRELLAFDRRNGDALDQRQNRPAALLESELAVYLLPEVLEHRSRRVESNGVGILRGREFAEFR